MKTNKDIDLNSLRDKDFKSYKDYPVLKRLIEEVRNDKVTDTVRSFDRIHDRHNR